LGQLLDESPKLRAELAKGHRFPKPIIVGFVDYVQPETQYVNNIHHTYKSKSKELDDKAIAVFKASVDNVEGKLLADTCSNINLVSNNFLESLSKDYCIVGYSEGRIL